MLKIGILREGKKPSDARVALTPKQCKAIENQYVGQVKFVVQPSEVRCISDADYLAEGLELNKDISSCDILLGIKEVPIDELIAGKTYYFFSHTTKKQSYNRKLLQAILEKNITLVDYERLTNSSDIRVIAFGRWAGIVGAHNGMMAYSRRTKAFELAQMHKYRTFAEALAYYQTLKLPTMRIALTGAGRVSNGAAEVLDAMGVRRVTPQVYLSTTFDRPVYTQINSQYYAKHKNEDKAFEMDDFYAHPENYESIFLPYAHCSDLMINGIFWDKRAPAFFTREEMCQPEFTIKTIADITCDIAPASSLPSTLFAATIAEPVFGYNPNTNEATAPYQEGVVDVMSIDNLPSELPIDASAAFGEQFTKSVLPEILQTAPSDMLQRATVAANGKLTEAFEYLQNYVDGKE
jgi:saccharopine dehydrogenase (NAD+, L-lysine forming)